MSEPKERPILFSGPMVNAILQDRKTHTRRIMKLTTDGCPYGIPGDRLWVREAFYQIGHWEPVPGVKTKTGRMKWKFVADSSEIRFVPPDSFRRGRHKETPDFKIWHRRLGRFMPRAASRITLEITGLKVERLQKISEADCIAEGIDGNPLNCFGPSCPASCNTHGCAGPRDDFQVLWTSINGPDSWSQNPYVWVIQFKRIAQPS